MISIEVSNIKIQKASSIGTEDSLADMRKKMDTTIDFGAINNLQTYQSFDEINEKLPMSIRSPPMDLTEKEESNKSSVKTLRELNAKKPKNTYQSSIASPNDIF